jgi:enamine deaminase RidA (YjgF/YER057c/UK114 family)
MIAGPCGLVMRAPRRLSVCSVFGSDKNPCRLVYGVASLPLGALVELEVIFEVAP